MKDEPTEFSTFNVMGMPEAVFAKSKNKARQCGNLDGPALVAIGTFHATAAMIGFKKVLVNNVLTGKSKMAWNIDVQTGQQVGDSYPMTELHLAGPHRRDYARGDDEASVECTGEAIKEGTVRFRTWLMSKANQIKVGTIDNSGPNKLVSFLRAESRATQQIDMAVAFVTMSGLDSVLHLLKRTAARGNVRLLTGLYQGFTEPKALRTLLREQRQTDGRLSVQISAAPHFHWKAYFLAGNSSQT